MNVAQPDDAILQTVETDIASVISAGVRKRRKSWSAMFAIRKRYYEYATKNPAVFAVQGVEFGFVIGVLGIVIGIATSVYTYKLSANDTTIPDALRKYESKLEAQSADSVKERQENKLRYTHNFLVSNMTKDAYAGMMAMHGVLFNGAIFDCAKHTYQTHPEYGTTVCLKNRSLIDVRQFEQPVLNDAKNMNQYYGDIIKYKTSIRGCIEEGACDKKLATERLCSIVKEEKETMPYLRNGIIDELAHTRKKSPIKPDLPIGLEAQIFAHLPYFYKKYCPDLIDWDTKGYE